MSAQADNDAPLLTGDVAVRIAAEIKKMQLDDAKGGAANNAGGSGFNADDEKVVARLTQYKDSILPDGTMPGTVSLNTLINVAYDSTSEYAKKTKAVKETYFAKFVLAYPMSKAGFVSSKYCSIQSAIMDLLPRPLRYGAKENSYATEYVTIYIPSMVVNHFKGIIEAQSYVLDAAGLNVDRDQALVSINANYSTENVPRLGIMRTVAEKAKDGTIIEHTALDKSANIEEIYKRIHAGGGVLFRGYAFGEFGVSKQVPVGGSVPPSGSTMKLTFKLMGFHVLSQCKSVRAIKPKSGKSRNGI